MSAAFADRGVLARTLPEFEPRGAQREMATAVSEVFTQGGVLLAEAGTGTGKTLAYLVPAILSRQRVLVSSGTKNLQEQIFFKDLPVLRDALGVPFTATYMKGRANYLCLHRFETVNASSAARSSDERAALELIAQWASRTDAGDRAEIDDLPEDLPWWSEIAATSENCLGSQCPRYHDCFVTRMRQRAAESDLVIVNHHLLCADAAVRQSSFGEVIPACHYAIVDEAHQLEDVATQYFGLAVSNHRLLDLARDGQRVLGAKLVGDVERAKALADDLRRLVERSRLFFDAIQLARDRTGEPTDDGMWERGLGHGSSRRRRTAREGDLFGAGLEESPGAWSPGGRTRVTPSLFEPLAEIGQALLAALEGLESAVALVTDAPEDLLALGRRAGEIRQDLRFVLRANDPGFVYYVETRGRGVFLRASPVDVSQIVRDVLLDRMQATVLTSATLSVDGSFEHVRSRLGIGRGPALRLPSEFDYERQAILYLPRELPDPRSPAFPSAVARQVIDILTRTQGRAFVLFTSYANLREVHRLVEAELGYPTFVQGAAPRSALLRDFRETPHAVLMATSSFWQGVDVVGEALSCVVIDKLPFASPADPITAARIEAIASRGGAPFFDYQIPLAILTLLQGLGRLIRHRRDRGVLAILDPRLRTMAYGRRFLDALPPAPITSDPEDISRFFARGFLAPPVSP